jgi:hypothetical protein
MFGGNAFGALGVEEPTSSPGAGPSSRQIDGEEVDAEVGVCVFLLQNLKSDLRS